MITYKNKGFIRKESSDKYELMKIKKSIYDNPIIRQLTTKLIKDDNWKSVKTIIHQIERIIGVSRVSYGARDFGGSSGYTMKYGKVSGKTYSVIVETIYGNLEGNLVCAAAGSVEDPLSYYDITLTLTPVK